MSLTNPSHPKFAFERDTFDFPNELYWEYQRSPGGMKTVKREPPPTYAHHCFVLVRSARQFLFHARFDANQAPPPQGGCEELIRRVVARSPRHVSSESDRVVIPGYSSLRQLSAARPRELKNACGGAWQSYFLRSHWRMVLPISRAHQQTTCQTLVQWIKEARAPIVHIFRFPRLSINHGLLLFDCAQSADGIVFAAYDPNIPQHATSLNYSHASREFHLPANHYWGGGRVDVVHTYHNWLY